MSGEKEEIRTRHAGSAFVFGSSLAMVVSWSVNKSLLWALVHGAFGWAYVVYFTLGFGAE